MTGTLGFLAGGGEASRMIRERDWTGHPMGPPQGWPPEFKAALSLVLNSPESMILAWGPELSFFFNETYFPLLGPRLPWAMGERFDKVWADGWEQAKPIIDAAFAGKAERFHDLPWKLGEDRGTRDTWWTFSYSRVLDGEGAVAGLFIFTNETTARVLGDAALRESEKRLRLETERQRRGLQQMPGFSAVLAGREHVFEYVNDAYVAISGRREFVGRTVRNVFPELEGQGFFEFLDRVYATGEPYSAKAIPLRLAGEEADRFIDHSYQPIRDDGGAVSGIFVGGYDVTEQVRAEQALATLNASLEEAVNERTRERDQLWTLSDDMLARANYSGMMSAVSPAWTRVLGWSETELLNRPYASFMHPQDEGPTLEGLGRMGATGQAARFENRIATSDGGWKPIEWVVVPESDGVNFIAVGRDLSLVKAREAELAIAQEALRQSQKMEAVGQLTGGLAHDFNNLLAGITGSLELLERRIAQGRMNDAERFVAAAQGAAKRAASLTHRLLAFSRRQTLDPKPTNVNRLIGGMDDLVRRTVGPAIDVEVVAAGGLWLTLVDPNQLENALLNLCINARDAMPEGGKLTVETANRWLDDRAAKERELAPGQFISMCVSDNGAGMAPETVAKAFDPFFTTKPIGQGTGLGLSMIYGFARQSGGQVRIYSEPGRGTMVCLYLPRHVGEADEDEQPAAGEAPRAKAGETVLVVDDEPTVRMLVMEVLEELGYAAIEAADAASGLKVLQSDARIDLLVSDVGLPGGMNGRQMADAARMARPGLKVLFITGYAENAVVGHGHLDPGMHVMTKPFALDALASRLRELIAN